MKTQRPVRLVFTREESIISTAKRHPSRTTLRMGLNSDGRIRALAMKMICDGGAYGLSTEGVMRKAAGILAAGPYVIPNVRVDTYGIYTNNTPSGAFRSFGALQTAFATEFISIFVPSGSAWTRSISVALTPCAMARSHTRRPGSGRSVFASA